MVLANISKDDLTPCEGSEFRTNGIHLHRENNSIDWLKCSSTQKEYASEDMHDIMIYK